MDIWLIFYLLAMSNAIINIDGQISVWISSFTFLGIQSEVKLLHPMANLSLIFEDPSYYFCRGGTTFTFPPSVSVQEFQFLHIFTNICQFPLIFLIITILMGMNYLNLILICVFHFLIKILNNWIKIKNKVNDSASTGFKGICCLWNDLEMTVRSPIQEARHRICLREKCHYLRVQW